MLDFGKYYFMPISFEEDFHYGWITLVRKEELKKEEIERGYCLNKNYPLIKLNELKDYLDKHKRTIIYDYEIKYMEKEYQEYIYSLNLRIASDNWMDDKEETDRLFGDGYYDKYYGNHESLSS